MISPASLGPSPGRSRSRLPPTQFHPAVGKVAGADLRAGQVGEDGDRPAGLGGHRAHPRQPAEVLLERAVAEVESDDVDAGVDQAAEDIGAVAGRPERGHDLRAAAHICLSIPQWNCLLVRHALPIRRELEEGIADPELSESGHRQAAHLAQYLSSERIDAVYSSPLTAGAGDRPPVAAGQGLDVRIEPGLAEWDQNSPEYIPVEELKAANDPRWQALVDGQWDSDEDEATFRHRTIEAIESIIVRHPGERVVAACHGGVINLYLGHILGLPRRHPRLLLSELHLDQPGRRGIER